MDGTDWQCEVRVSSAACSLSLWLLAGGAKVAHAQTQTDASCLSRFHLSVRSGSLVK